MQTEYEKMLTIRDTNNRLLGFWCHDMNSHTVELYLCEKASLDEIKDMVEKLKINNEIEKKLKDRCGCGALYSEHGTGGNGYCKKEYSLAVLTTEQENKVPFKVLEPDGQVRPVGLKCVKGSLLPAVKFNKKVK